MTNDNQQRGTDTPEGKPFYKPGGVRLLTPAGQIITVQPRVFQRLRRARFLFWNKEARLRQMKRCIYGYADIFAGFDPASPRHVQAYDYSQKAVPAPGKKYGIPIRQRPAETIGDILRREMRP
jgi:hypothetical protein